MIALRIRYSEIGIGHAQGIENPLAQEGIERQPRHDFYESAEHVCRNAIVPLGTGLVEQRNLAQPSHHALERLLVQDVPLPVDRIDDGIGEISVGEALRMTQQVVDRYGSAGPLRGDVLPGGRFGKVGDLKVGELR